MNRFYVTLIFPSLQLQVVKKRMESLHEMNFIAFLGGIVMHKNVLKNRLAVINFLAFSHSLYPPNDLLFVHIA